MKKKKKPEGDFYLPKFGLQLSPKPQGNPIHHSSKDKAQPSLFICRMSQLILLGPYNLSPTYVCGYTLLALKLNPFQLGVLKVSTTSVHLCICGGTWDVKL